MSERRRLRVLKRKVRRALWRMSDLQRKVFCAMRFEADMTYAELAERYGLTEAEVQSGFAGALFVLARAIREPDPSRRRWWPW